LARCLPSVLLAILVLWPHGHGVAAAQSPAPSPAVLTVEEFAADLDRVAAEIGSAPTAADAMRVVPRLWRVRASEQTVDVPAEWLFLAIVKASKDEAKWGETRTQLQRRLGIMRAQVIELGATETTAVPEAREALAGILASSEFQRGAVARLRDSLQARISDWLERMLSRFFAAGPGAGRRVANLLAWAAGLTALAGLSVFLVRSIVVRRAAPGLDLAAPAARRRPRDMALLATKAIEEGNLRDAIRWAYGAALLRLEEDGALRVDASRTPREHLKGLARDDRRYGLMTDLTRRFERVWYGNRPPASDDGERVVQHLEVLGCLRPGERAI
jgi:hypothetical protein